MTFIDNVSDKTNIDIVVSETKGGHEARDDPKAGLESVQKIDHVGAGSVGSGDEPPRICPAWQKSKTNRSNLRLGMKYSPKSKNGTLQVLI